MRTWLAFVAAIVTVFAAGCTTVGAPAQPTTLRVMGFAGTANAAVFIAQDKGFFAARGLDVQLSAAPNSATQIAALREGRIDLALTAMDNIIPYPRELFAFLGLNDGGRMSLMVAPAVKDFEALRGRPLAVDAVASGYAYVLMEMLARGGLTPDSYQLVSVGGSGARLAAMRSGRAAGALLNAPTDTAAEKAGFLRLATSADVLNHYQGSVGAARRAWAADNADTLVRYIQAHVAALDWLYAPQNHAEAVQILARRLKLDAAAAERSYEELVAAKSPTARKGALDIDGIGTVLNLRRKFAPAPPPSANPAAYYDLGYYEKALAR